MISYTIAYYKYVLLFILSLKYDKISKNKTDHCSHKLDFKELAN